MKARRRAERHLEAADSLADAIPLGQPILQGHHSERRHRRDLEKIRNNTTAALKHGQRADELARRAEAARNNDAIFADDPEAISKLRSKLARLEQQREEMKAANRLARAEGKHARHERWEFQNLGSRIRSVRTRIADLQEQDRRAAAASADVEQVAEGQAATEHGSTTPWRLVANHAENRVQVFFGARPAKAVCRALRERGFRWARSVGAWQRHLSGCAPNVARDHVEYAVKKAEEGI